MNFKIPEQIKTKVKTIRFPCDIIEKVEKSIANKNCTFTAFVIAAVRAALNEIE